MTRTRSSYGQLLGGKTLALSDLQGEKPGKRQRGVRSGGRTNNWKEKICPHCQLLFFTATRGVYCSIECSNMAYNKRKKDLGLLQPKYPDQIRLRLCK